MVATLTKLGNTRAIVINKTLREQMGIDDDTRLELTVINGNLLISPAHVGIPEGELLDAADRVRDRYGETLKRLA